MIRRFVLGLTLLLPIFCLAQVPVSIRVEGAKARIAPDTKAQRIATLHKGELFIITDDQPYWYEIKLRNGRAAWVRKAVCTVIDKEEDKPDDVPTPGPPQPVPSPTPMPSCTEVTIPADWSICPATGTGGMYGPAYIQKNRLKVPCAYTPVTVADMLALQKLPKAVRALPDSDPDVQYLHDTESKAVMLEGFLAMTKDGGVEGVNCKSSTRLDTHMEIVDNDTEDPRNNRPRHVVTEVTPWFHDVVPEWSTNALGQLASYVGGYGASTAKNPPTKVRIYGYLFFDEAHASGADSWRGTAWEIHPITKIEVFQNGGWETLGSVH